MVLFEILKKNCKIFHEIFHSFFLIHSSQQCSEKLWFPLRMPKTMKTGSNNHKIHFNFSYLCIRYVEPSFLSGEFDGEPKAASSLNGIQRKYFHIKPKTAKQNHFGWVMVSFCRFLCLAFYVCCYWNESNRRKRNKKNVILFACIRQIFEIIFNV